MHLLAAFVMLIVASARAQGVEAAPKPLWPGSRYSDADRDRAVERGVRFLYRFASDPEAFTRWDSDLLWCFYSISATSANPRLREMARAMGYERAVQWRRSHPAPPQDGPGGLSEFVHGDLAAAGLGVPGEAVRDQVRVVAARYRTVDFLGFDPACEPPPADLPENCTHRGTGNPRGAARCARCNAALKFKSRYEVWLDALILTYRGDKCGVPLGAAYADVLRWIVRMRPYPSPNRPASAKSFFGAYAVTHVIYTLDDYSRYGLSKAWLPAEFQYLRRNLPALISRGETEMLGEFMDSLRAFGVSEEDPVFRAATDYELSHQNPDGSWGDPRGEDLYTRYHATWSVVDGLREYRFAGVRLRNPELMPMLGPTSAKPHGKCSASQK